jgi:hypothetical protein
LKRGSSTDTLQRLDDQALRYFEVSYRVWLSKSGVVCDGVTRRRLLCGQAETAVIEQTEIFQLEVGFYLLRNGNAAHIIKHESGHWYGGTIEP